MSHLIRPRIAHVNWLAELERSHIRHIHRDSSSHSLILKMTHFSSKHFQFASHLSSNYEDPTPRFHFLIRASSFQVSPCNPACITTTMPFIMSSLSQKYQRQKSLITSGDFFFFGGVGLDPILHTHFHPCSSHRAFFTIFTMVSPTLHEHFPCHPTTLKCPLFSPCIERSPGVLIFRALRFLCLPQ